MVRPTEKAKAFRPVFEAISRDLLVRVWGEMPEAARRDLMAGLECILGNLG